MNELFDHVRSMFDHFDELKVSTCRNLSQLCFLSQDQKEYFREDEEEEQNFCNL